MLQITASKVESATCVCLLNSTKDKEVWLVCLFADDVFMPDCPSKKGNVSGNPRRHVSVVGEGQSLSDKSLCSQTAVLN